MEYHKNWKYEKVFYISLPLFYFVVILPYIHHDTHACYVLHAPYVEQSVNFYYFFTSLYIYAPNMDTL